MTIWNNSVTVRDVFRTNVLLLAILIGVSWVPVASSRAELEIEVSTDIQVAKSGPEMEFRIRNTGAVDIHVPLQTLPWVLQRSVILVAVALDQPQDPLTNYHAFQHPPRETVTIPARKEISGTVSLRHQFREFESILKKAPILIFWSYQLRTPSGSESRRFSGHLLVPKAPGDS